MFTPGHGPDTKRLLYENLEDAVTDVFDTVRLRVLPDATEIASRKLDKVVGVESVLDVIGVDNPFTLVVGDSKNDLRVMEWVAEHDAGIAAAPEHASARVLDHVRAEDDLVFDAGATADILHTAFARNRLAENRD